MEKIGNRVGAIQSSDGKTVKFYGYGTYIGDEVPDDNVGGFNLGLPTPKIELDNGNIVYGCECWWGSANKIASMIDGLEIINVLPERSYEEN